MGAAIGGGIGTAIAPGPGTLIGGGLGLVGGALGALGAAAGASMLQETGLKVLRGAAHDGAKRACGFTARFIWPPRCRIELRRHPSLVKGEAPRRRGRRWCLRCWSPGFIEGEALLWCWSPGLIEGEGQLAVSNCCAGSSGCQLAASNA
jgi:hypothetical protein